MGPYPCTGGTHKYQIDIMSKFTTKERETQRLQEKASKRADFIGRNYRLVLVLRWVGYPIAALLSGATEFWSFYGRGQGMVVAITLTVIIEGSVYWFGKEAVDDLNDGMYNGDRSDKALFLLKVIAFVAIFSFSIYRSIDGGPFLTDYLKTQFDPIELSLLNDTTVDEKYAEQRAEQTALIDDGRSMTWRGRITKEGWALINPATQKRNEIDELIKQEKAEIKAINAATTLAYEEQLAQNARMSIGIVGIGQALFMFCVIIIGLYDSKVEQEVSVIDAKSITNGSAAGSKSAPTGAYFRHAVPSSHSGPTSTDSVDPTADSYRRPVGFGRYSHQAPPTHSAPASVATRSYTLNDPHVKAYLLAFSRTRSRISTEERNLVTKNGRPETVRARLETFKQDATAYQQRLLEMGFTVRLKDNQKYVLEAI